MSAERPLSPHLQTYKLPFTAQLSIVHRMTGFVLSTLGLMLLVFWLVGVASGPETMEKHMVILNNPVLVLFYFVLTFFLFYHVCNGIRHMIWDAGVGLEINEANKSGRIVLIVSTVLTVIFWIIIG